MFGIPGTWIGVAVLAILALERGWDRWMRWRETRALRRMTGNPEATTTGNPNGVGKLAGRLAGHEALTTSRLDALDGLLKQLRADHDAEWDSQRAREDAMHEKMNKFHLNLTRDVARIQGSLDRGGRA